MNALLSTNLLGMAWLTLLFLLCFVLVHTVRLVRFGQKYCKTQNAKTAPAPTPVKENSAQEKTPPAPSGEPIYYIVERKKRPKSTYTEPKRIDFK